jgi:LacI family transcriptional regulator
MARVIFLSDFSEEYSKRLLRGIVQYSKENQLFILCKIPLSYREQHKAEVILEWAKRWNADGIIAQFYDTDRVNIFKENGIVAIAQNFKTRFTEIPNITSAHRLAGKMGADYFLNKGFKNFAFYGLKDIVWSQERLEGFRNELRRIGWVYEFQSENFMKNLNCESGSLIAWLKTLPKPVAMMACDDNQGHYLAEICKQYGVKIPEEISLLGVDNDEAICNLSDPPISSIDQAVEKGGYEAARLMDKLIANPGASYEDVIVSPTRIIARQSTDIFAGDDKYISTVLQYIHQHYGKILHISDLALLVPLSRRLLENRFKQVTGSPIYTYIMNLRMNKFVAELLETTNPIIEIATKSGFPDCKNIARQFKQAKGCTPTEYRMKYSLKK